MLRSTPKGFGVLFAAPLLLAGCATPSESEPPDHEESTGAVQVDTEPEPELEDDDDDGTSSFMTGAGTDCPPVIRPDQGNVELDLSVSSTDDVEDLVLKYKYNAPSAPATIQIHFPPSSEGVGSEPDDRFVELPDSGANVFLQTSGWSDNDEDHVDVSHGGDTWSIPVYGEYAADADPRNPTFAVEKLRDGLKLIHVDYAGRHAVFVFHGTAE